MKRLFLGIGPLNGKTNLDNIIGLDTGCVWGNKLTAIRLEDEKLFHVSKK